MVVLLMMLIITRTTTNSDDDDGGNVHNLLSDSLTLCLHCLFSSLGDFRYIGAYLL